MVKKRRVWQEWYRVIQGRDLLDPASGFKFNSIPEGLWKSVQLRAVILLKDHPNASKEEREHWQRILDNKVPFGLQLESKRRKHDSRK